MFIGFFYTLKEAGLPVSPTSFLTLQRALEMGLINSTGDFYTSARTILVKSERFFDIFDQVFAHHFDGVELPDFKGMELDEMFRSLLDEWLSHPKELANMLGIDESQLAKLNADELLQYFKDRLDEQKERHEGGNKWIGTGGTSPVGHSGYHPGGMRVGGMSRNKSAMKVAASRRYKDYSCQGTLTESMMGEALKRLRHLVPSGAKDNLDIDKTIVQTMKNGGEIELVFERSLKDRLNVILAIDNGGWSMDPYIPVVQALFTHARAQFKYFKTIYFHNTIYSTVWEDPERYRKEVQIEDLLKNDPETRIIFVGDASMGPYELIDTDGGLSIYERSGKRSIDILRTLSKTFPHTAWLNPIPKEHWHYTHTIKKIGQIFPMFDLSLDGLEKAVNSLMVK
ncbi:MAG: hypothetical protein HQL32_06835 [Planctomycetes bacterium]|nr:hypothetical protein [Planctomycetota bacterium]